jgi:hypothetical protein
MQLAQPATTSKTSEVVGGWRAFCACLKSSEKARESSRVVYNTTSEMDQHSDTKYPIHVPLICTVDYCVNLNHYIAGFYFHGNVSMVRYGPDARVSVCA